MFKVAKKWDLNILEKYDIYKTTDFYYVGNFKGFCYQVDIDSRELEIIEGDTIYVNRGLSTFYKLIKDGIIEEV